MLELYEERLSSTLIVDKTKEPNNKGKKKKKKKRKELHVANCFIMHLFTEMSMQIQFREIKFYLFIDYVNKYLNFSF